MNKYRVYLDGYDEYDEHGKNLKFDVDADTYHIREGMATFFYQDKPILSRKIKDIYSIILIDEL